MTKYRSRFTVVLAMFACIAFSQSAFASNANNDFDDDGTSDFAVYRPFNGTWFIINSENTNLTAGLQWGLPGDLPIPGRYTSSSRPDLAVYRPTSGVWLFRDIDEDDDGNLTLDETLVVQWGGFVGDQALSCDFNEDGRSDLIIFRNGTWFVLRSPSYDDPTTQPWGLATDTPVPQDFDGDGRCDYTVYRDGTWLILLSSKNFQESATVSWGSAGDIPVVGRYDNDSLYDFAVYREGAAGASSVWMIRESSKQGLTSLSIPWGTQGDIPVATDVDGDDRTDIVVWRPSEGNWYALLSSAEFAEVRVQQWGLVGDTPIGDTAAN